MMKPPAAPRPTRTRVPPLAWLLLLLGLVLATAPAWRPLLIATPLPLDALLRLRC